MGLVIALNKGRILEECLPLLARCRIQPEESPDKSRRLIFNSLTGGHRLIIARSADVPTYVENGVADVGITGKDTILEYGSARGRPRLDRRGQHFPSVHSSPPQRQGHTAAAPGGSPGKTSNQGF